jgi:hypothetical protein
MTSENGQRDRDAAIGRSGAAAPGDESALERRARELLRESTDRLDGRTRSRLAGARAAAVEAARGGRGFRFGFWVPVGTLAAAAAIAFLTWSAREHSPGPQFADNQREAPPGLDGGAPSPLDDLEILATHESFELLEELEFYAAIDLDDAGAGIG